MLLECNDSFTEILRREFFLIIWAAQENQPDSHSVSLIQVMPKTRKR